MPAILALMVSIGVERVRTRARVTLADLLATRDASLVIGEKAWRARLSAASRTVGRGLGQAGRLVVTLLTLLFVAATRHGLVLAGIAAWTWAAWQYSTIAGAFALGLGLFFLEARRR